MEYYLEYNNEIIEKIIKFLPLINNIEFLRTEEGSNNTKKLYLKSENGPIDIFLLGLEMGKHTNKL